MHKLTHSDYLYSSFIVQIRFEAVDETEYLEVTLFEPCITDV